MPYKDRSERIRAICNWGTVTHREDPPCTFKVRCAGLCRRHHEIATKKTRYTICTISTCEDERDSYGDGFCTVHGELNNRSKCIRCGKTNEKLRSKYCKECKVVDRPCHKKTCKKAGTVDFYGRFFCMDHYPERKLCIHVTRERRCRRMWFDYQSDQQNGRCSVHGGVEVIRRRKAEYSGRCCATITLETPIKCKTKPINATSKYCKNHCEQSTCLQCDQPALAGYQQLCETHINKKDEHC